MRFLFLALPLLGSGQSKRTLLSRTAVLSVGLLITGSIVGLANQNAVSQEVQGVAVIVEVEEGALAPAIFRGTRGEAASASGGDFHFHEVGNALRVMAPGTRWEVGDGVEDLGGLRRGWAIVVQLDDESRLPGMFLGPYNLATATSRVWAETQGLLEPTPDQALVLPEANARVRSITPGTAIRTVISGRGS